MNNYVWLLIVSIFNSHMVYYKNQCHRAVASFAGKSVPLVCAAGGVGVPVPAITFVGGDVFCGCSTIVDCQMQCYDAVATACVYCCDRGRVGTVCVGVSVPVVAVAGSSAVYRAAAVVDGKYQCIYAVAAAGDDIGNSRAMHATCHIGMRSPQIFITCGHCQGVVNIRAVGNPYGIESHVVRKGNLIVVLIGDSSGWRQSPSSEGITFSVEEVGGQLQLLCRAGCL